MKHLNYAPYLDYRPLGADDPTVEQILSRPECAWISRDLEQKAQEHAIETVVPEHLLEVKTRRIELITKTEAAVKDRLTKEINYWDHRAEELKHQEQAGKPNARLNSNEARKRADELQARLERRMDELQRERQISPLPPVVMGGLLVIPSGLVNQLTGRVPEPTTAKDTTAAAAKARDVVMGIERSLGISEYVAGQASLDEVLKSTAVTGLTVVTTGQIPPNPSELLMHPRFEVLLGELAAKFDTVIVDAPPVLAVSDAAIIGRHVGATLMIARAGKHPIRELEQAVKRLNQAGVQVKGFVFNDLNVSRQSYRYGYKGYVYRYSYKT